MIEALTEEVIQIPDSVEVSVKSRVVTVKGKYGELQRSFKVLPVEFELKDGALTIRMYQLRYSRKACMRTVQTHIENMIKGVCYKFQYKMRIVYSHFPINVTILKEKGVIEIRHFMGEARTRIISIPEGVDVVKSTALKDELIISGADVENVGRMCALLRQNALVRNKDIRKFLDGIYVSEKGLVEAQA